MSKGKAPQDIKKRRSPPHLPSPKPTTRWWKVPLEIFLVICSVFGLLAAVVTFLPKLSIDASGSLRSHDPLGTVFYVSNDGILPVYDLNVRCVVDDISTKEHPAVFAGMNMGFPDSQSPVLSPGHKMTTPCAHALELRFQPEDARLTITVAYKPFLVWWHKTEIFPLDAEKSEDGTWVWKNVAR